MFVGVLPVSLVPPKAVCRWSTQEPQSLAASCLQSAPERSLQIGWGLPWQQPSASPGFPHECPVFSPEHGMCRLQEGKDHCASRQLSGSWQSPLCIARVAIFLQGGTDPG